MTAIIGKKIAETLSLEDKISFFLGSSSNSVLEYWFISNILKIKCFFPEKSWAKS